MNGLMEKYKESLSKTPGPVKKEDIPNIKLDMRGLVSYATQKDVQPTSLSNKEKQLFVSK